MTADAQAKAEAPKLGGAHDLLAVQSGKGARAAAQALALLMQGESDA